MKNIPEKDYKKILKTMPVICVDLIIKYDGKYLLVKRNNDPQKGIWFVPGGRVLKDESIKNACVRKIKQELGIEKQTSDFLFKGYYEEVFDTNAFNIKGTVHTISLVHEIKLKSIESIRLDSQSCNCGLFDKLPENFKVKDE